MMFSRVEYPSQQFATSVSAPFFMNPVLSFNVNDQHQRWHRWHRLTSIPPHLRISVLFSDESIIVIHKPSLLRAVPGHANSHQRNTAPSRESTNTSSTEAVEVDAQRQSHRQITQAAWIEAIRYYRNWPDAIRLDVASHSFTLPPTTNAQPPPLAVPDQRQHAIAAHLLTNLAARRDGALSSVPRKILIFQKYCRRNVRTLLPPDLMPWSTMVDAVGEGGQAGRREEEGVADPTSSVFRIADEVSATVHRILKERCRALDTNMPESTADEESALGQLKLLLGVQAIGARSIDCAAMFGGSVRGEGLPDSGLYVVHRLDCETSGVMVFARNNNAASILSKFWREHELVTKVYLARVQHWPPYHEHGQTDGKIDLPLSPIDGERLKWHVDPQGKPSTTIWRVLKKDTIFQTSHHHDAAAGPPTIMPNNHEADKVPLLTLELKPITGRTHQLRVHCAAVGSGIEGDSLYGDSPIEWAGYQHRKARSESLQLHAHRLSFPHPYTGNTMVFSSDMVN